jgi:tetratricopeptide (TPR) repeat protein
MRIAVSALLAAGLCAAWPMSLAAQETSAPTTSSAKQEKQAQGGSVAELLTRLAEAQSPEDARSIENRIEVLWSQSGSASADLLLRRASEAADDKDLDTAMELLNRLNALAPDFAEAWYRRAEIAVHKENYNDAVASLQRALQLQPAHFLAQAELGQLLEELGDKAHALDAYRKALKLDPQLDGLDDRIRVLTRDVEGQAI